MLRRMWRISDSNAEIFGEAGIPLKINIILFPQPLFKVSNALSQGAWLRSNIFLWVRIRSLLIDSKTQKKATEKYQSPCSAESGEYRIRTDDLLHAMQAL